LKGSIRSISSQYRYSTELIIRQIATPDKTLDGCIALT
jgi:hypothetical protein